MAPIFVDLRQFQCAWRWLASAKSRRRPEQCLFFQWLRY